MTEYLPYIVLAGFVLGMCILSALHDIRRDLRRWRTEDDERRGQEKAAAHQRVLEEQFIEHGSWYGVAMAEAERDRQLSDMYPSSIPTPPPIGAINKKQN